MPDLTGIEQFANHPFIKYPAVAAAAFAAATTAYSRASNLIQIMGERRIRKFLRYLEILKDRKGETEFLENVISEEVFRSAYGVSINAAKRDVVMRYVREGITTFETLALARIHYKVRQGEIVVTLSRLDRWMYMIVIGTSMGMILFGIGIAAYMGLTNQFSLGLFITCFAFVILGAFFLFQNSDLEAARRLERELGEHTANKRNSNKLPLTKP